MQASRWPAHGERRLASDPKEVFAMTSWRRLMVFAVAGVLAGVPALAGSHQIGGGVHYWKAVDDIDVDDVDEDGFSYVASYRYKPAMLLALQAEVEVFPDNFLGIEEKVYAPQAMLILGSGIYAGLGVGAYYFDGDFADEPFYILRAGLDLEVLPRVHLDLNGNYYFSDFDDLSDLEENVNSDTITLGAALRLEL
jgi:hypothetical protein